MNTSSRGLPRYCSSDTVFPSKVTPENGGAEELPAGDQTASQAGRKAPTPARTTAASKTATAAFPIGGDFTPLLLASSGGRPDRFRLLTRWFGRHDRTQPAARLEVPNPSDADHEHADGDPLLLREA